MSAYRFSAATREALDLSRAASVKRNHEYIGTEHILFGLLASKAQPLDALVEKVGIDRDAVAFRLDSVIARGKGAVPAAADLPFTSRAKRAIDLAIESAGTAGTIDVGPEHLLLGICAEERGIAAQVLMDSGVTTESVRTALRELEAS